MKVVNEIGESNTVTFKTKEITYREVTLTLDFKNKTAGSEVENLNIFKGGSGLTLLRPTSTVFVEHSQAAYNDISNVDGKVSTSVTNANKSILQRLMSYNVIKAIELEYPDYFYGLDTIADKIAKISTDSKVAYGVWGYASGADSTVLSTAFCPINNNAWGTIIKTDSTTVAQNGRTLASGVAKNIFDDQGFVHIIAFADQSDGTTASSVSIDYAKLEITFLVEDTRKKVVLPDEFSWKDSGIEIYKDEAGVISTDFDVEDFKPDITGLKTYYISPDGANDNDGLSSDKPFRRMIDALNKADCGEIILADGLYPRQQGWYGQTPGRNMIIRASEGAKVVMSAHDNLSWVKSDGYSNVYQASRSSVLEVYDAKYTTDENYERLKKVSSIDDVETTAGSWYTESSVLYVHTFDSREADNDIRAYLSANVGMISGVTQFYLEGITFEGGNSCLRVTGTGEDMLVAIKNCTFKNSTVLNGVTVLGADVYLQNCEASENMQDGFNYHISNNRNCQVSELNCRGFKNGRNGANQNNGSTMHDGGKIIRVNCEYFENSGPNMIDVNEATESYNVGVYAHDSTATVSTISNSDFKNSNTGVAKMWLDSCKADGSSYSLVTAAGSKTYLANTVFDENKVMTEEGAEVVQYETEYE